MLYNTMLKAMANAGDVFGAEKMYSRMRAEGVRLNSKFYGKLLETAAKAGDDAMARQWFADAQANGVAEDQVHFACMLDAHAKAGDLDEARRWLERTRDAGLGCTDGMFHTLLFAHASRGQKQEAVSLLGEMEGFGLRPGVMSYGALALAASQVGDEADAEQWMQRARQESAWSDEAKSSQLRRKRKRQRRELEIQKWLTHYNFQAVDIPRPLSRFTSEQEMVYPVHVAAIATYLVIVGDCTVLRHLLATGADLDQESSLGRTAYDFACETNNAGSHGDVLGLLHSKVSVVTMRDFLRLAASSGPKQNESNECKELGKAVVRKVRAAAVSL
ncbi:unnamed protein product [Effrenium voratum]|nr:unnamed protein product [Effrenium voratum]